MFAITWNSGLCTESSHPREPRRDCPELCVGTLPEVYPPVHGRALEDGALRHCRHDWVWHPGSTVFQRALSTSVLNFQTTRRGFGCKEFIWEVIPGSTVRGQGNEEMRGDQARCTDARTTDHPWDLARCVDLASEPFHPGTGVQLPSIVVKGCSVARERLLAGRSGKQQAMWGDGVCPESCRGDRGRWGGHRPRLLQLF